MAARGRPSAKEKEKEDARALGVHRVPENQKREVYERVRRAMEAKTGVCTSHKVGSSSWDKDEQRVLEDGLRYYPHDQHSNMLIYIRIAAGLPKKTVRDVAHHLRHMQDEHRAKVEAAAPGMNNPAKRHHPDPGAAAAMAAMHEHQMAAMFAANAAAGMAAMQTLPGLAPGLAGPSGPGPHLKDEKVEARVCTLLQENMALINSIRENMVMGRFFDNHPLMIAFDKNVKEVTALLATLPFAEMQKLPVQINPYFITGSLPVGVGVQLPGSPSHHVQPPPGGAAPPPAPSGVGVAGHVNGSSSGNGAVERSGHNDAQPAGGVAEQPDPSPAAAAAAAAAAAGGGRPPVVDSLPPRQQQQQPQEQQQQPQQQPQQEQQLRTPVAAPPPIATPAPQNLQQQDLQRQAAAAPVQSEVAPNAAGLVAAPAPAAPASTTASTHPTDPVAEAASIAAAAAAAAAAAVAQASAAVATSTGAIAELPADSAVNGGDGDGGGGGSKEPLAEPSAVAQPEP
ncbi:unnamed protein product [Ectocarpus sp. 12 AP-2014]